MAASCVALVWAAQAQRQETWGAGVDETLFKARARGLPALLLFTRDDRPLGGLLRDEIVVAVRSGAPLDGYYCGEGDARENEDLLREVLGVPASLAILFYDTEGRVQGAQVGFADSELLRATAARAQQPLGALEETERARELGKRGLVYRAQGLLKEQLAEATDAADRAALLEARLRLALQVGAITEAADDLAALAPLASQLPMGSWHLDRAALAFARRELSAALELLPEAERCADLETYSLLRARVLHELGRDAEALACLDLLLTADLPDLDLAAERETRRHLNDTSADHTHAPR
jgi:tetratricopeptide (TPR) repeat protein